MIGGMATNEQPDMVLTEKELGEAVGLLLSRRGHAGGKRYRVDWRVQTVDGVPVGVEAAIRWLE